MKSLIVCDLDGTLLRINTFPLWIRFLTLNKLKRLHIFSTSLLVMFIILRLIRLIQHRTFKRLISRIETLPKSDVDRFVTEVAKHADVALIARLKEVPESSLIIATAASDAYAGALVASLDLPVEQVIATTVQGSKFIFNSGETKRKRVLEYIRNRPDDGSVFDFLTDHYDDIPLAMEAREVLLCNPTEESIAKYRHAGVHFKIFVSPQTLENSFRSQFRRLDCSSVEVIEVYAEYLTNLVKEKYGLPELLVSIETGGSMIGEICANLWDIQHTRVKGLRSSKPNKLKNHLRPIIAKLPDNLKWYLRGREISRAERHFHSKKSRFTSTLNTDAVEGHKFSSMDSCPRAILIVDDAVDSGLTLLRVRKMVENTFPKSNIYTACFTTTFRDALVKPDIVLFERTLLRGPWSLDN